MSAAPLDQRVGDVAGFERFVGAAIGEEAAFAVRVDERDRAARSHGFGSPTRCGVTPIALNRAVSLSTSAAPTRATKSTLHAERGEPRRLIGRRSAGLNRDRRAPVRAARERPFGRTMTSVITSPMTRMRGRPGHSDMAGATGARTHCARGFASSQQFHEIAPAAEALLEGCDIGRLFGGGAQAAHAGDEAGGLLISAIAAPVREFIDALRIDVQSLARMLGLAFAREALLDRPRDAMLSRHRPGHGRTASRA